MKYVLMAWRDAICCFFGWHDYVRLHRIMPFCRRCGKARWL